MKLRLLIGLMSLAFGLKAQTGLPLFKDSAHTDSIELNSGYLFDFTHSELSNILCDNLFNIYHREGTLVTLDSASLTFSFSDTSILNPSVANKFMGSHCEEFYKNINIFASPKIIVEVLATQDCQVGFLVGGDIGGKFTYADGRGYRLQRLYAGKKTTLEFNVPHSTWKGVKLDLTKLLGWGVQVKGPNGEPLPKLHESRKISLYSIRFGNGVEPKIEEHVEEVEVVVVEESKPEPPKEFLSEPTFESSSMMETTKFQVITLSADQGFMTTYLQPATMEIRLETESDKPLILLNSVGEMMNVPITNNRIDIRALTDGVYTIRQGNLMTRFVR